MARKHFTYLKDSRSRVEVMLGDARLSLEREPPQRFHVLALASLIAMIEGRQDADGRV